DSTPAQRGSRYRASTSPDSRQSPVAQPRRVPAVDQPGPSLLGRGCQEAPASRAVRRAGLQGKTPASPDRGRFVVTVKPSRVLEKRAAPDCAPPSRPAPSAPHRGDRGKWFRRLRAPVLPYEDAPHDVA